MKKVQYLIFTMLLAVLVIGFADKKIVIPSKNKWSNGNRYLE